MGDNKSTDKQNNKAKQIYRYLSEKDDVALPKSEDEFVNMMQTDNKKANAVYDYMSKQSDIKGFADDFKSFKSYFGGSGGEQSVESPEDATPEAQEPSPESVRSAQDVRTEEYGMTTSAFEEEAQREQAKTRSAPEEEGERVREMREVGQFAQPEGQPQTKDAFNSSRTAMMFRGRVQQQEDTEPQSGLGYSYGGTEGYQPPQTPTEGEQIVAQKEAQREAQQEYIDSIPDLQERVQEDMSTTAKQLDASQAYMGGVEEDIKKFEQEIGIPPQMGEYARTISTARPEDKQQFKGVEDYKKHLREEFFPDMPQDQFEQYASMLEEYREAEGYKDKYANSLRNYNATQDFLEQAESVLEGKASNTQFEAFAKSMKEGATKDWLNIGMKKLTQNIELTSIATKARNEGLDALTDAEMASLTAYGALQQTQATEGKMGYDVGKVTADMVPFIAQFALTSGLGASAKKITEESVQKILKNYSRKKLKNIAAKTIGYTGGVAARTPAMPVAYVDIPRRVIGGVTTSVDSEGDLVVSDIKDQEEGAVWKGAATGFLEVFSEGLGAGMGKIAPKIVKNTKPLQWVADNVKISGRLKTSIPKKFQTVTGWNGVVGEYSEELVNSYSQALVTGDQKLSEVWDGREQAITAISVGIMGGGMFAMSHTPQAVSKILTKKKKNLDSKAVKMNPEVVRKINNVVKENSGNPNKIADEFDSIMEDSNFSEQEIEQFWGYALDKITYDVAEQTNETQKQEGKTEGRGAVQEIEVFEGTENGEPVRLKVETDTEGNKVVTEYKYDNTEDQFIVSDVKEPESIADRINELDANRIVKTTMAEEMESDVSVEETIKAKKEAEVEQPETQVEQEQPVEQQKGEQDAIQEQEATEIPAREQAEAGEEVGQEVRREGEEVQEEVVEPLETGTEQQPVEAEKVPEEETQQAREPFVSSEDVKVEIRDGEPVAIKKDGKLFKDQTKGRPQRAIEEYRAQEIQVEEPIGYKAQNNLFVQIQQGEPVAVDQQGNQIETEEAKVAIKEYKNSEAEKKRQEKIDNAKNVLSEELGKWANIKKVSGQEQEKFNTKKVTKALADIIDANLQYMSQGAVNTFNSFYDEFSKIVPEIQAYPKNYIKNLYQREVKGQDVKEFTDSDMMEALEKQPAKEREPLIREIEKRGTEGQVQNSVKEKFKSLVKGLKKGRAWQKAEDAKLDKTNKLKAQQEKVSEARKQIEKFLKENKSSIRKLKGIKVSALANKVNKATPNNIDSVIEYIDKIINDAEYREALVGAREVQSKLKKKPITDKASKKARDKLTEINLDYEGFTRGFLQQYALVGNNLLQSSKKVGSAGISQINDLLESYEDAVMEAVMEAQVLEKIPRIKTLQDFDAAREQLLEEYRELQAKIKDPNRTEQGEDLAREVLKLKAKASRLKSMITNSIKFGEVYYQETETSEGTSTRLEAQMASIEGVVERINNGEYGDIQETIAGLEQQFKEAAILDGYKILSSIPAMAGKLQGVSPVMVDEALRFKQKVTQLFREQDAMEHISIADADGIHAIAYVMSRNGMFPDEAHRVLQNIDKALFINRINKNALEKTFDRFKDSKSLVRKRFIGKGETSASSETIREKILGRRMGDLGYMLDLEAAENRALTDNLKGDVDAAFKANENVNDKLTRGLHAIFGKYSGKSIKVKGKRIRVVDGISYQPKDIRNRVELGMLMDNLCGNANRARDIRIVHEEGGLYKVVKANGEIAKTFETKEGAIAYRDANIEELLDNFDVTKERMKSIRNAKVSNNRMWNRELLKIHEKTYNDLLERYGEKDEAGNTNLIIRTEQDLLDKLNKPQREMYKGLKYYYQESQQYVEVIAARNGREFTPLEHYFPAYSAIAQSGMGTQQMGEDISTTTDIVAALSGYTQGRVRPKSGSDITRTGQLDYINFDVYDMTSKHAYGVVAEYTIGQTARKHLDGLNQVHKDNVKKHGKQSDEAIFVEGLRDAMNMNYKYGLNPKQMFSSAKFAFSFDDYYRGFFDLGHTFRLGMKAERNVWLGTPTRPLLEFGTNAAKHIGFKPVSQGAKFTSVARTKEQELEFLRRNSGNAILLKQVNRAEILTREPLQTKMSSAADFFLTAGDAMSSWNQWMNFFLSEYERIEKEPFSFESYLNIESVQTEKQRSVERAMARANEWYDQQYTPLSAATRQQKIKALWGLLGMDFTADQNMYKLLSQLQTFNMSEAANFTRNVRDIIYGTNDGRARAVKQSGMMFTSMMMYNIASVFAYNVAMGLIADGFDDHYTRKIINSVSLDGIGKSALANLATVTLGRQAGAGAVTANFLYSGLAYLSAEMRGGEQEDFQSVDKDLETMDEMMRVGLFQDRINFYNRGATGLEAVTADDVFNQLMIAGAVVRDSWEATGTAFKNIPRLMQDAVNNEEEKKFHEPAALTRAFFEISSLLFRYPAQKEVSKVLAYKERRERKEKPKEDESFKQYRSRILSMNDITDKKWEEMSEGQKTRTERELNAKYEIGKTNDYHANQFMDKGFLSNFQRAWFIAQQHKKEPKKVEKAIELLKKHDALTEDMISKMNFFIENDFDDSEKAEEAYEKAQEEKSGASTRVRGRTSRPSR